AIDLVNGVAVAANSGPEVVINIAHNGFDNTSAQMDKPIQGMFLPLAETFTDFETAATALGFKAEIIDANGVAHLIGGRLPTALGGGAIAGTPYQGLSFAVDLDATGAVVDGHITGTPTNVDGSSGFPGAIHVRVTAIDDGTPRPTAA